MVLGGTSAVAMGSPVGLLMRFTASVTSLAVNKDHTLLGAGSSEFTVKVMELNNLPSCFSLTSHQAPVLAVTFDPRGELLASSSCDGTVRVWSLDGRSLVQTLSILAKSTEVSHSTSLCQLAWGQDGNVLAVPVGAEVKLYSRNTWTSTHTLSEPSHHKEAINMVRWSPDGRFLACADVSGNLSVWQADKKLVKSKMRNENQTGITALEWDSASAAGGSLIFADNDGYVGKFECSWPGEETTNQKKDLLAEDSLLMEGIPADEIFQDDFDDSFGGGDGEVGVASLVADEAVGSDDDRDSVLSGGGSSIRGPSSGMLKKVVPPKFSEKQVEVYQTPWQPSATPIHLQHRFMVYNLVGVVRCHDDDSVSLVEVDFHDSSTHHSFSLPNSLDHTMAVLNHQALVLACPKTEDAPSQLQCVHFSSWDTHKDWTLSLPNKESIKAVAIGDDWIAMATSKGYLRVLSIGGVQKEVLSVPGHVVTLAGGGSRLCIVYQTPPCTSGVYSLTVWVLDVHKRKQLLPPHMLPTSHHAQLRWIGFSEKGCLVSYDSKGMVRIHGNSCYGGSSWIPILDTTKQLGNKDDSYFIVGMTHDPDELRGILCKGLDYPPVHPKPVMSSLCLHIPLCEPDLERTEHERKYLQDLLVCPPSQPRSKADLVQKLMKMFALACKSEREYKAWEIAGMLPDIESIELAMTYASRTSHVRLAQHISDLIQGRALEDNSTDSDSDGGDSGEGDEGVGWAGHNGNRLAGRQEGGGGRRGIGTGGLRPLALSSHSFPSFRKPTSIFGQKSNTGSVGSGRGIGRGPTKADETAELFSDSDGEGQNKETAQDVVSGEEMEGEVEDKQKVQEEQEDDEEEEVEEEGKQSPYAFGDSSFKKRSNPFKITTPISKKMSVERQHGFLHKISASVDEERKSKEAKKLRKENSSGSGGGGGVGGSKKGRGGGKTKTKTTTAPQKKLTGSFFKSKQVSKDSATPTATTTPTTTTTPTAEKNNGNDSVSKSHDLPLESCDQNSELVDGDGGGAEVEEEEQTAKLSSSQRLAGFAFKPTAQ